MQQHVVVRSGENEQNRPPLDNSLLWPRNFRPTRRELQVLRLICDGSTSKEIAAQLGISFKTATCHRAKLMSKAGVHSSIALFRWALANGFVALIDPHEDGWVGGDAGPREGKCARNSSKPHSVS
jgi:DNA-binding NarL/FixJ family response regulator